LGGIIALGFWLLRLDGVVQEKFEGKRWAIPARVYARPLELYAGAPLSRQDVLDELAILNYRQQATATPGTWQQKGAELYVHTRGFQFSDSTEKHRYYACALMAIRWKMLPVHCATSAAW
jgi:penicillin-binding protein 1B